MKSKFFSFLRNFDFFGAPLFQQIDRDNSLYRSLAGGILTLLICAASLTYSIIILYQWQNNQLSPKIQHSAYVSDFSLLDFDYDAIRLTYWKPYTDLIDPFEANVLIPIISYTSNYTIAETYVMRLSNQTTYDGNRYIVPKMKLGFSDVSGHLMTTKEMYIYIVKCDQSLLPEGEFCASDETAEKFYSQPTNTIVLQLNYKTLDSKDKTVKISVQEYLFSIENKTCYTFNTYLQSTLFEINDAFLFGPSTYQEYIDGALIQPQTNSIDYCKLSFGYETYVFVYVVMAGTQNKSIYEYPHASDLFANIGSIISILFLLKYIILFINNSYLQQSIIEKVIKLYYPQFSQIQIVKNWRGKIKNIKYNSTNLDKEEKDEFIQFLKRVTSEIRFKFSIVNILYEMSRLYLLFRENKTLEEIKKVHLVGIKFDFLKSNLIPDSDQFSIGKSDRSQETFRDFYLVEDDLSILSLDHGLEARIKEVPKQRFSNDFYEMNRIG